MKKSLLFVVLCFVLVAVFPACNKQKSYPCPGLGQVSEADLSKFDENGQLKDSKGKKKGSPNRRIDHESGLVNKKSPKGIRATRRTRLY